MFGKNKKRDMEAQAQANDSDDEAFDAQLSDDDYTNIDGGIDENDDVAVAAQLTSAVSATSAPMPTAARGFAEAPGVAPAGAPMSGFDMLLSAQKTTNTLLSHLVVGQADQHQRQLSALAAGSNAVTREVHLFVKGTLEEFSKDPSKARLVVPAGTLPHTMGTLTDVSVVNAKNTFPASMMLKTVGIKNLAEPGVISPSGVIGVCMIPAKCKEVEKTSIISSVESEFSSNFTAQFPGFTANTLKNKILENEIVGADGSKRSVFLVPAEHPVAAHILDKYEAKGIDSKPLWSGVTQKYQFENAEVNMAINELKKKLVTENTAVNMDELSFTFERAILSQNAVNDKSALATAKKWVDQHEIEAHIKSGNAAQELSKTNFISLKLNVTYVPAAGSLRSEMKSK